LNRWDDRLHLQQSPQLASAATKTTKEVELRASRVRRRTPLNDEWIVPQAAPALHKDLESEVFL